ncbi:MAG TPA: CHAD domain-containing protein [Terriglobia bacterium]|nr:CHAD domain-containing protein [Terriglobia bacterium]
MSEKSQAQDVGLKTFVAPTGVGTPGELRGPVDEDSARWGKARKLALAHLDRILELVPKILRSENPDRIHDLRVASRRLQAVLDVLTATPASSSLRRLRRKIKRSRTIFSDVRNCDVLIGQIERRLKRRRAGRRKAWNAALDYLRERRSKACARAVRKLAKINLGRVYIRLQSSLAPPPGTVGRNGQRDMPGVDARDVRLESRLTEELEKAWLQFRAELAQSQQSLTGRSIHKARIAAKELRYLVEVMDEFRIPGSWDATRWLRQVQQYLGDWHDLDVAEQMLAEMLARPQFVLDQLEIAAEVIKLILLERKMKRDLAINYQKMALASAEGARLQAWVETLLTSKDSSLDVP